MAKHQNKSLLVGAARIMQNNMQVFCTSEDCIRLEILEKGRLTIQDLILRPLFATCKECHTHLNTECWEEQILSGRKTGEWLTPVEMLEGH